ncbi:hypothetical protein OF377_01265 [Ureaplasma sp. ES3154-GEN]|uniref:hypothetical protein n=1 Tax=Ureaplasma sp. ES3154-GEN TaxID=2984844 RepID=UPI0021E72C66|nr:hypothetical protein [Ureaplasma sp. ES3154-GEN]MCV3743516.1 hypothetical protein [Ureaplasma sp. ES3154-GEN]
MDKNKKTNPIKNDDLVIFDELVVLDSDSSDHHKKPTIIKGTTDNTGLDSEQKSTYKPDDANSITSNKLWELDDFVLLEKEQVKENFVQPKVKEEIKSDFTLPVVEEVIHVDPVVEEQEETPNTKIADKARVNFADQFSEPEKAGVSNRFKTLDESQKTLENIGKYREEANVFNQKTNTSNTKPVIVSSINNDLEPKTELESSKESSANEDLIFASLPNSTLALEEQASTQDSVVDVQRSGFVDAEKTLEDAIEMNLLDDTSKIDPLRLLPLEGYYENFSKIEDLYQDDHHGDVDKIEMQWWLKGSLDEENTVASQQPSSGIENVQTGTPINFLAVEQQDLSAKKVCCTRLDRTIDECITCYLNHPRPIIDPRVKYLDQRLEILANMQQLKSNIGYQNTTDLVTEKVVGEPRSVVVSEPVALASETEELPVINEEENLVDQFSELEKADVSNKFKILDETPQTLDNMAKYQNEEVIVPLANSVTSVLQPVVEQEVLPTISQSKYKNRHTWFATESQK